MPEGCSLRQIEKMERIERKRNSVIKKIVRWLLLLAGMIVIVYGYTRIPYFVVKQNLTLQNNYSYENYDEVLEKRRIYLSDEYMKRFETYDSMQQKMQYMKEHKEACRLISLELGTRNRDGSIPYTAVYELSYEDGVTSSQRVHVEGVQFLEREWFVWWKVTDNGISHSCLYQNVEGHGH